MNWPTRTLGEITKEAGGEIRTGPFGSQLHKSDYVDDPDATPVVMPKDMANGKINTSSIARIDEPTLDRLNSHILNEGDIVLGRRGEIGRRAWVGDDEAGWLCGTGSMRISVGDGPELTPRYLYYYMELPQTIEWLKGHSVGATMSNLSAGVVQQLPVTYPPISIQLQIIDALDSFEALIENNRRRIKALEEMARLLYREWFVRFRFPGHECAKLIGSELGPVPEGWNISAVSDAAILVRGRSYRRHELSDEGGVPFLNLKCIERGGGFRKSGLKRYTGRYKEAQRTYPGDTVIAVTDMTQERNIVGQAGRVPSLDFQYGVVSLDLARVVPMKSIDADYLYGMLRFSRFSETVREHANGTNVLHLNPDRIKEYRYPKPPIEIQQLYGDSIRPMLGLIDKLTLQSEVLGELRDLLLPRLVSGELDISDLELNAEALGV